MAKIYETKEDFQRDKLAEQMHRLDKHAHVQDSVGWGAFGASILVDMWNMAKQRSSMALSAISTALLVTAVIQWVKSWRTSSKSHDLALQRERLGPEMVVLPASMAGMEQTAPEPEKPCSCHCRHKKYGQGITPKTLADYAEKPAAEPGKAI